MTNSPKKWNFQPKTPRNGFITSTRLFLNDFDIIYKVDSKFKKIQRKLDIRILSDLRRLKNFRYANVYDIKDRVQVASFTPSSFKWLVKYIDDIKKL